MTLVQSVGSQRILGRRHDLYDVHCEKTRWWVITDPTNLYQQSDFPEVEQALIFHVGLGVFIAERNRRTLDDPEAEEHVSSSWRRFSQAIDDMNDAEESEDYQAVGVKCRDALIALGKEHAAAEWVGDINNPPKAADFKGWANVFGDRLSEAGRLQSYLKAIVDKTWDLTVWLQHNSNATPVDADIVIEATGQVIGTFAKLIRRHEHGEPDRCPRCESYRMRHDVETDEKQMGFWESEVCASCGWQSEPEFTSFHDHFEGTDVAGYLSSPGIGVQTGSIRDAGKPEGRDLLESIPHRTDGRCAGRGTCPCDVTGNPAGLGSTLCRAVPLTDTQTLFHPCAVAQRPVLLDQRSACGTREGCRTTTKSVLVVVSVAAPVVTP